MLKILSGSDNKPLELGCILANRSGSVGYVFFYHRFDILYSNDTRKSKPF